MKRITALVVVAAMTFAACSSAVAPTPQIIYVTPPPSGIGSPTPTPAETSTSTPVPALPSPTPSLASIRAAAASRYSVIDNAYVTAFTAFHKKTFGTSDQFASYAQARSYYRTEVRNLQRFDTKVRAMTFPSAVMPDVRVLLLRTSQEITLMQDLAGRDNEYYGWQLNQQILKADDVTDAARVAVGKDLGLTYGP